MTHRPRSPQSRPHPMLHTVLELRRSGACQVVVSVSSIRARWPERRETQDLSGVGGELVPVVEETDDGDGCRKIGF